jgi:hypothetical protein
VSDQCGDGLLPKLSSRGAAFDDLDGRQAFHARWSGSAALFW